MNNEPTTEERIEHAVSAFKGIVLGGVLLVSTGNVTISHIQQRISDFCMGVEASLTPNEYEAWKKQITSFMGETLKRMRDG